MKINGVGLLNLNNKNKINFNRSFKEHQSWGVNVDDNGASAKIFVYPDSKKVALEVNKDTPQEKVFQLDNKGNGIFEKSFKKGILKPNDTYQFVIECANGTIEKVKDPYSKLQPTLLGPSVIYNHSAFKWSDYEWFSLLNQDRISRIADDNNNLTSLNEARIYELNVATLTKKGNFEGVKEDLKRIKELGFNAIEIMPVENTYSFNWGYDGVDKFAPATYMGGADKLKELVNEAHKTGLNVIMDMVPNHIGVDGSHLQRTAPYKGGSTPWGDAFNYEGEDSRYVRDYIVNAALNWIYNYHCDGLRLDMTKFMNSDTTMQQIAAEVNYHFPHAFLIAEDARSNISVRGDEHWYDFWQPHDERITIPLKPHEVGTGESEYVHNEKIEDIAQGKVTLSRLGYDSEWDFHFYHTLTQIAYGETDLNALERAIVDSQSRVKYSTSHDETGNMDGTRLVAKYMVPMLKLNEYTYLDETDIQRAEAYAHLKNMSYEAAHEIVKSQKAQQTSMKLAQLVQDGTIESLIDMPRKKQFFEAVYLKRLGINSSSFITPKKVLNAFNEATRIYRAIETLKYFTPGPVMTFQGEENINMTKFNFFREFDSIKDERYLYTEKGYPYGVQAYEDSILTSRKFSESGLDRMQKFQNLITDLNEFSANNPSTTSGKIIIQDTVKHYQNPTIALHAKDEKSGNETFIVSNFSSLDYPSYNIEFPVGSWVEVINSNDEKYGGTGMCQNDRIVNGFGHTGNSNLKSKIALPAKSSIIFKRI